MSDLVLSGRRILVVEDEMMILMLVENMLEEADCSVLPASTVSRALAIIESENFDAAILDVNLDGTESYPVADALTSRGIPFVFSTGYGRSSLRPAYRHLGVVGKPYRQEEILSVLSSLFTEGGINKV